MVRQAVSVVIVEILILEALSSHIQPTYQQYIHFNGFPHATTLSNIPVAHPVTRPPQPVPTPPNPSPLPLKQSINTIPSIPAFSIPTLLSEVQKSVSDTKPSDRSSHIDATVLNNLAIALQLLIVSNILNRPLDAKHSMKTELPIDLSNYVQLPSKSPPCSKANYVEIPRESQLYYHQNIEIPNSQPYYYEQQQPVLLNGHLVGGIGSKEPDIPTRTRASMILMSPYEALGPTAQYADALSSQFETSSLKKDFKSPYAMFSEMNDFY